MHELMGDKFVMYHQALALVVHGTKIMKCQCCGEEGAMDRRQRTAYVDDDFLNFAVLCDACQVETHEYWQDMWDDYYTEIM